MTKHFIAFTLAYNTLAASSSWLTAKPMSFRGGRGGRRAGVAGGGRAVPMTEEERNAGSFAFPTDTYPKTSSVPIQTKASRDERIGASHFLKFRTEIRDGPLYTGDVPAGSAGSSSGSKSKRKARQLVKVEIESTSTAGVLNDGIKRYTDRYHKKRKAGKSVEEHPYVIDFFPKELYAAMGVVEMADDDDQVDDAVLVNEEGRRKTAKKFAPKKLDITKFTAELLKTSTDVLEDLEDGDGVLDEESRKRAIENIKKAQDEGGKESKDDEEEEKSASDAGEEDFEDEFEEDDDDDYNAEKYFDDGEGGDDDDGNDEAAY